jgi:hypothetical protein
MTTDWQQVLGKLADQSGLHGLIAGRCTRFLLHAGAFSTDEAATRFSLALSRAADPAYSAAWSEGFLQGSGILLVNDQALWQVVDGWVTGLHEEHFQQQLPILRRTFSTFQAPERRALGERVNRGQQPRVAASRLDFDVTRARRVLPLVAQLLGLDYSDPRDEGKQ